MKWFEGSYRMQSHLFYLLSLRYFGCEREKQLPQGRTARVARTSELRQLSANFRNHSDEAVGQFADHRVRHSGGIFGDHSERI